MLLHLCLVALSCAMVSARFSALEQQQLSRWRRETQTSLPPVGAAAASGGVRAGANSDEPVNWAARLRSVLLPTYDRQARPHEGSITTNVTVGLTLKHVSLDERTSTFTAYGWIKLAWQDSRLKWNASDYGGMEILHLADHEIWQPDITLYNSASGTTVDHYGNTMALVTSSGAVLWVPPTSLSAFCALDLRKWPRDEHECSLKLGSWTYDATKIDLVHTEPTDDPDEDEATNGLSGGVWRVSGQRSARAERHYSCCVEPYVDLTYFIKVARRGRALLAALISPAAAVSLLLLSAPLLSPSRRAPPLLAACLASVLFLVHFARSLPAMADHTPHIVMGYCGLVWVSCFWVASSAAVAALGSRKGPAPNALRRLVTARACALLVSAPSSTQDDLAAQDKQQTADGTWNRAASALDRLATLAGVITLVVLIIRAAL